MTVCVFAWVERAGGLVGPGAAGVDGAGPLRSLRSVLLSPAGPALGTLAVLVFLWT